MDWLYRFITNENYPDPVEEIDALCTLDDNEEQVYLLLADRNAPPMSGALCGEVVGLCTANNDELILHATAVIDGIGFHGNTPPSVEPLYGKLSKRTFLPLVELNRLPSSPLDRTGLSIQNQKKFLNGQAFVKKMATSKRSTHKPSNRTKGKNNLSHQAVSPTNVSIPIIEFSHKSSAFTVMGLDPTAGTWTSNMTEGPKEMPSFCIKWDGNRFHADKDSLRWHSTNLDFWTAVQHSQACMTCIDGPCNTNGPQLSADRKSWNTNCIGGTRSGELALSRDGINLFWTTQNTVMKFEGASRWIARSLVLFSEQPNQTKIETHPHGAFTFLWRMFGNSGTPPKKSKPLGRQARIAILRAFITGMTDSIVPNHDAVDAACAALVAGFHQLSLTKSFGTVNEGGFIWMPDIDKLAKKIRSIEGAIHV